MSTPNKTGLAFEQRCISILKEHRDCVQAQATVRVSKNKSYKPDAVTDTELFEFKYQQVEGSVASKLTQAIIALQLMFEKTELKPYLVYDGKKLQRFIEHDPAFIRALTICPAVTLFTFEQFYDYVTASTDCNDREQEGYVEHTTACAV